MEGALWAWGRAIVHYDLGQDADSDSAVEELIATGGRSVAIAAICAYRGESDKAFEWLDHAYAERNFEIVEIRMSGAFDSLHKDPRWDAMVEKIGMTDEVAKTIGL